MKLADMKITAPKILIYGQAGTGKSVLAATLGEGCKYLDIDNGITSASRHVDPLRMERIKIDVEQFQEDTPLRPGRFYKAKSKLLEILNAFEGGKRPYKSFVLDSLSSWGEWAMQMILYNNNRFKSDGSINTKSGGYEIQDWGLAMAEVERTLGWIRSLPIPVVVVAHETIIEISETSKRVDISVIGSKLAPKIPTYFDEVWHMKAMPQGGNKPPKMLIQTQHSGVILARSRLAVPNDTDSSDGLRVILSRAGYNWE